MKVPDLWSWGGQKDHVLRTRKLYNILAQAIIDTSFRESIFRKEENRLREWNLNPEERAYLDALPYAAFEQMVGRMAYHWFVPRIVNDHYLILPASAADNFTNAHIPI